MCLWCRWAVEALGKGFNRRRIDQDRRWIGREKVGQCFFRIDLVVEVLKRGYDKMS